MKAFYDNMLWSLLHHKKHSLQATSQTASLQNILPSIHSQDENQIKEMRKRSERLKQINDGKTVVIKLEN